MVRHIEKGDIAETEEVTTATNPDKVYENSKGNSLESAAIDKDTETLKVSSDDRPRYVQRQRSGDRF